MADICNLSSLSTLQRLASDFLSDYIFLAVGRVGSSTDLIAQKVEFVDDKDKRSYLADLLRSQSKNGCLGSKVLELPNSVGTCSFIATLLFT